MHVGHTAIFQNPNNKNGVSAFKFAGMPFADARASQHLYAQEVMPELRKLGSAAPFDSDEVILPAFMAERKQRAA